jgi:glycosyltransferase involved in cell wall biosynthesis
MSQLQNAIEDLPAVNEADTRALRVCIVAEHASRKFGGEAILPWHYFRRLRLRGIEAWLVVHARTRAELTADFSDDIDRIIFVPDSTLQRVLWKFSLYLPREFRSTTTGLLIRCLTAVRARRKVRQLVRTRGVTVVHEPIPVSPRNPSFMFGVGAPVIIGPLNGNMEYPPGFQSRQKERRWNSLARPLAELLNHLLPGKLRAHTVLVANERTRRGLPRGIRGRVRMLCENGVDMALWQSPGLPPPGPIRFAFLGLLVRFKAVDLLLRAFAQADLDASSGLDIVGDGPERPALEQLAADLGIAPRVVFHGFRAQAEAAAILARAHVFTFASLGDCGGAVVL